MPLKVTLIERIGKDLLESLGTVQFDAVWESASDFTIEQTVHLATNCA